MYLFLVFVEAKPCSGVYSCIRGFDNFSEAYGFMEAMLELESSCEIKAVSKSSMFDVNIKKE